MSCQEFHGGEALARAVEDAYARGQTDYSLEPMALVDEDGKPVGKVKDGDHVVFCCRRGEREIELTEAFTDPEFTHFDRPYMKDLDFVIMTMYHEKFKHLPIAFAPERVQKPLAQVLSEAGLRQFHCAESEKYAHVTFFFNGGVEKQCEGEERCLVPSPKEFATYDLVPQMSAEKVCDKVVEAIASEQYALIVCNFANCDMVGHTGVMEAAVQAVETVDACIGRIVAEVGKHEDVVLLVTADHGNADCMFDETGKVNTAHTTNPVPFCVTLKGAALKPGKLADIAPTILHVMGLEQPAAMTGECLLG